MERSKCIVAALVGVLGAASGAQRAEAQTGNIYVAYYTPQFYQDYLVFYDEEGTPIYYENDTAYSVPPDDPAYNALASHFRNNVDAYIRWYQRVGYANLHYRRTIGTGYYRPLFHEGYPIYFNDAGFPYYYVGGRIVLIPRTHQRYGGYIAHFRAKRAQYLRWNKSTGRRFHGYRQVTRRHRRIVNTRAPRAVRGRAAVRTYRRRPAPVGRPVRAHQGGRVGRPDGHRRGERVARPAPERHGQKARQVDCRRNPGHPACRGRKAQSQLKGRQHEGRGKSGRKTRDRSGRH